MLQTNLLLIILALFVHTNIFAATISQKSTILFQSLDVEGKFFKIQIQSYINHLGSREVQLQAMGAPKIINGANPTLGWGRDLNDNGIIDTWFFIQDSGVTNIQKEGKDPYGRDVLPEILLKKYRSNLALYAKTATLSVFKYLLISTNESLETEAEYFRDWMDLQEANIRFEELAKNPFFTHSREQTQEHFRVQTEGYRALAQKMEKFAKLDFWAYTGADAALWFSGAIVFKWAGEIIAKAGKVIIETAVFQSIKAELLTFAQNQKNTLLKQTEIFKEKMSHAPAKTISAKVATSTMAKLHWKKANVHLIKATRSKNILLRSFAKVTRGSGKLVKGAFSEWRYITLNASVQLGAETFAHLEEVKSDNPLEFAENVLSNKEIQQNIAFMSSETIMMTAASKNLKTTKAKFAAGGMIAMVNSTQMNLFIKQEENYERIAFDTAWEMVVGNTQVQLDLIALQYFEKLSVQKNNPKLKLIGYAVALVDMFAGYYVYSKATSYLEDRKNEQSEPQVKLVPILVEN